MFRKERKKKAAFTFSFVLLQLSCHMRKSTGSFSKCLTEKHKLEIVGLATCWVSNKPARDRHFIS